VSKIGIPHMSDSGAFVIADLDTVLIAVCVELVDRIIPQVGPAAAAQAGRRWCPTPNWSAWQ
jgi:hypothetical protein